MTRDEIILAAMSPANGAAHSPVQVQKLLFLIDQEIPDLVGGPHFDFQPYDYGPFDKTVYEVLTVCMEEGFVEIDYRKPWRTYRLTPAEQSRGAALLDKLTPKAKEYVIRVSQFVRALSFSQLVTAIYAAYPEMRKNSVFNVTSERIAKTLVGEYLRLIKEHPTDPNTVYYRLVRFAQNAYDTDRSFWAANGIISHYFQLCDIFEH